MQNLQYFFGKVVLITGAASGVGRALALKLAHPDIKLILMDQNDGGLKSAVNLLNTTKAKILSYPVDVSQFESLKAVKNDIQMNVGRVDIILHCAAVTRLTDVSKFNPELAVSLINTNYGGTVNIIALFLNEMMAAGSGHIVGISSMAACRGLPDGAYYSASKGAVNNLLESLRIDLRNHGILVTNFIFGFIKTPMNNELEQVYKTPMIISPEKAADIILRSVSRKRRLVYGTTRDFVISILVKNLPAFLWDRICIKDTFRLRKVRVKTKVRRI